MTITITAPNGSTVQFPDGTDHETINGVMTQNFHSDTPRPDKYQQAAIDEDKTIGGADAGYTRRLTHGATLGADSTILAGLQTPLEMFKRGTFNPAEGYNYAKAREDLIMNKSRENTGLLGTAAEVLGGGSTAARLASGGLTTAKFLAPDAGFVARSLSSAADAAGLGGFSGAMEGNGIAERFNNAVKGLAVGGAMGGLTPAALKVAGAALSPIISNIRARTNPQGFAESQIARGIHESGINPDQLSLDAMQAANEGQPQFTLADAMGNAGQRLLSTVARAPGEGRTAVVNALEGRQGGQGRRISGALAEGFGAPETAAQTEARLTAARGAQADINYGVVRNDAKPVDVTGTIAHIDRTLGPAADQMLANPGSTAANDSVESVMMNFRNKLARTNPDDFAGIQRIRGDMADSAQSAMQGGYGNRARLIRGAVGHLDTAMENASAGHLAANRDFAQASRNIESVQSGRDAAMRGRTEDTVPAFQALGPEGQQAFRSGYVDPLIAQTQGAAFGANKARPLLNDAFAAESGAMAPGNPMMQRRIGREQTMFESRNAALGGSKTADNLNDHAAMGVDPHLVGQIVTGNWHGAVKTALAAGHNAISGNTPAVRQGVANILLQNGANVSSTQLRDMVQNTVARIHFVQNIARNLGRGAAGGLAIAAPNAYRNRQ